MDGNAQDEREIRAARNQALFRSVNEKMLEINEVLGEASRTFTIACECADTTCVQILDLSPEQYSAVRADPRHFAVLPGHIYPEVEKLIEEFDGYVVVEKKRLAAEIAKATAPTTSE